GVFIATLIGLVLAMIALGIEVLYYRKGSAQINDGSSKMALKIPSDKNLVSRINVAPAY
ncbi:hypothetical protein SK128_006925, partial [Halocaridina rubra]